MSEKLDIPIDLDLSAAFKSLGRLKGTINASVANASAFEDQFGKVLRLTEAVDKAIASGSQKVALASGKLIDANALHAQLLDATQQLQSTYEKYQREIQAGNATLNIQLISMRSLNSNADRLAETSRKIEQRAKGTQRALESAASVRVIPPSSDSASTTKSKPKLGSGALFKVGAIVAGATAFSKVNSAVKAVSNTIGTATSKLDMFNLSRLAAKADPALNFVKGLFNNFGDTVAKIIDWITKRIDSMFTHWDQSAEAGVGALGKINSALERAFLMVIKHVQRIRERMSGSAFAEGTLIPGLNSAVKAQDAIFQKFWAIVDSWLTKIEQRVAGSPIEGLVRAMNSALKVGEPGGLERFANVAEGMAGKLQGATEQLGMMEAQLAGVTAVATGRFPQTSGVVASYASAVEAAAQPARLLNREIAGATRVVHAKNVVLGAARRAYTSITAPIAAVRLRNQQLNEMLQGTPKNYRRWAIAIDWAKIGFHGLVSTLKLVIWPIQKLMQLLMAILAPLRILTKLTGIVKSAGRGLFGFGKASASAAGRAADLASGSAYLSSSLIGVANSGKRAHKSVTNIFMGGRRGVGGMLKGLLTSKLAIGALISSAIAWGGATAVATETAQVKFGTLLQDMDQGKALVSEITKFSAGTPFSNADLRESTALLLNAKIPADQITAKMTELGDIAAGVGKPITEISQIYQKLATKPKLGLGELDQLAERGIPIYDELQKVTGKSRAELFDMISKGKVGLPEVNQALKNLTTEGGKFAGGMAAQSQTFAGLWSTLKDNVAIALEGIAGVIFPFAKRMVGIGISIAQGFQAAIQRIRPVLDAWFSFSLSIFRALWRGVVAIFNGITAAASWAFGGMLGTGGSMIQSLIEGFLILFASGKFVFDNFGLTWDLIATNVSLAATTMFLDMVHWLTVSLPTYLSWFGDNWQNLFIDLGNMTKTIFTNLFENIKSVMKAAWDWIASGGTASFEVAWTPLLEGFEATTAKLPNIPPRAVSEIEKGLKADSVRLGQKFGEGLGEAVDKALKTLDPIAEEKLKSTQAGVTVSGEGPETDSKSSSKSVAKAIDARSAEALNTIFGAAENQLAAKQYEEQKKQTKSAQNSEGFLKTMANRPEPEPLEAF